MVLLTMLSPLLALLPRQQLKIGNQYAVRQE
jgi:hypothetical protein